MPRSGQKMLRPVSASPLMTDQLIAEEPRWSGSRLGWYWIVPRVGQIEQFVRENIRHERHHAEFGLQRPPRLDARGFLEPNGSLDSYVLS